jgi:hypothetical protein
MKKYIILILAVMSILTIGGCKSIKNMKYTGKYELYSMTGSLSKEDFEYYTITLEKDGTCIIESKGKIGNNAYKAEATYEIEDDKIMIYTKTNSTTITEVFDYIDGEIHMLNQSLGVLTYSAKLRRND